MNTSTRPFTVLFARPIACKFLWCCRLAHSLPPPFLDRFEKYSISAADFWAKMCQRQSIETQAVVDQVLQKLLQFVSVLGVHTFSGFSPSSTAVTVLMTVVQQQLSVAATDSTGIRDTADLSRQLLRAAVSRLLQIAKPHKMLHYCFAGRHIPEAYITHYFSRQHHFSFKAWLTDLLSGGSQHLNESVQNASGPAADPLTRLDASNKWVVTTSSCASLERIPTGVALVKSGIQPDCL